MKKREYFIYISGEDLDSCLLQLESLDHRPHGHVVISAIGDNINITRKTKKESVSVEVRASGYWPFEMGFPWNRFKRLMLKNHASVIKISIPISANGEAKLIADGMHISPDEVSEQLSLALVSDRPDWAKPAMSSEESYIVERIRQIDAENESLRGASFEKLYEAYERDQTLSSLIKKIRGSKCQICGYSFKRKDGELYVECHHLEGLSNNGLDCSKNILVLCANHHRQFHYGNVEIIEHTDELVRVKIDDVLFTCSLVVGALHHEIL